MLTNRSLVKNRETALNKTYIQGDTSEGIEEQIFSRLCFLWDI